MDADRLKLYAEVIAAVLVAVGLLWAWWKGAWGIVVCLWGRFVGFWKAILNLPHAMHAIPAELAALRSQGEERGTMVAAQGEILATTATKVEAIANTQRAMMNTNPRVATFQADNAGLWIEVNRIFGKWTGLSIPDSMRWGWLNAIHWEDQGKVREKWESCVADCRRFEMRFRMVHATTGKVFEVDAFADPIPENTSPCDRWFGSIYEVATASLQ